MTELKRHDFQIAVDDMAYTKERFLTEGRKCATVRFVGAFHGDNILTNEITVECHGIYPGDKALYVVSNGKQSSALHFDLTTCRFDAEHNLKSINGNVQLVFTAEYEDIPVAEAA